MSKTLLAESIAELKQLKQFAIENAKLSFEETITPQIKAILESALAEETEEEVEETPEKVEESKKEDEAPAEEIPEKEEVEETFDIDAALAEIEGTVAEGDDNDEDDDAPAEDDDKMREAEEAPEADFEVEGGDDKELDEDYINRLLAEVEDEEAESDELPEATEEDEEMNIAEVEGMASGEDKKKEQLGLVGAVADWLGKKLPSLNIPVEKVKEFEKDFAKAFHNATGFQEGIEEVEEAPEQEKEEATEQAALLESLREMNLLNAKLLYQNKLLLQENFSDEQKANIIKALDKAATANEAKIVFETYKGMSATKKAPQTKVTEKLGFKRIGVLQEQYQPKTSYDPTDPVVAELQRRAGIKK